MRRLAIVLIAIMLMLSAVHADDVDLYTDPSAFAAAYQRTNVYAQPPRTGTAGLLGERTRDKALVLLLAALALATVVAARIYAGRER